MISKELITEALRMYPQYSIDDECTGNIQYKPNSNVVHFEVNNNGMSQLNTYELAHKCKEWAYNNGFEIESAIMFSRNHNKKEAKAVMFVGEFYMGNKHAERKCKTFYYSSEVGVIFKACQWILDNKKAN